MGGSSAAVCGDEADRSANAPEGGERLKAFVYHSLHRISEIRSGTLKEQYITLLPSRLLSLESRGHSGSAQVYAKESI